MLSWTSLLNPPGSLREAAGSIFRERGVRGFYQGVGWIWHLEGLPRESWDENIISQKMHIFVTCFTVSSFFVFALAAATEPNTPKTVRKRVERSSSWRSGLLPALEQRFISRGPMFLVSEVWFYSSRVKEGSCGFCLLRGICIECKFNIFPNASCRCKIGFNKEREKMWEMLKV